MLSLSPLALSSPTSPCATSLLSRLRLTMLTTLEFGVACISASQVTLALSLATMLRTRFLKIGVRPPLALRSLLQLHLAPQRHLVRALVKRLHQEAEEPQSELVNQSGSLASAICNGLMHEFLKYWNIL